MRFYLAFILMTIVSLAQVQLQAQAQSIDGLRIGDDQSVLENYPNLKPTMVKSRFPINVFSDKNLKVTINRNTGKIVKILKIAHTKGDTGIFSNFELKKTRYKDIFINKNFLLNNSNNQRIHFLSSFSDFNAPKTYLNYRITNDDKMDNTVVISFIFNKDSYVTTTPVMGTNKIIFFQPSAFYNKKEEYAWDNNAKLQAIALTDLDYIAKTEKVEGLENLPLMDWQEPKENQAKAFKILKAKDYFVSKIYNGPQKDPSFNGANSQYKRYRTALTESFSKSDIPIFAGQYGFGFIYFAPSNHDIYSHNFQTGKIDKFPLGAHYTNLQLIMRQDSNLLLARWEQDNLCKRQYFSYRLEKWHEESAIESEGPAWNCALIDDKQFFK
ncbi:hypothetical protein [Bartonella sp. HY038]|uniref:hypothetical protein n=1 Tax=Bartonella sp. HY038 TaxID=2759660 RepID=UPI0015F83749|nr:hypothetical protein [Bartonella sp. HY038]